MACRLRIGELPITLRHFMASFLVFIIVLVILSFVNGLTIFENFLSRHEGCQEELDDDFAVEPKLAEFASWFINPTCFSASNFLAASA